MAKSKPDATPPSPPSEPPLEHEPDARPFSLHSALRALTTNEGPARLTPTAAVLLLGYLTQREQPIPDDVVGFAETLRKTQPMVWVAFVQTNYMRLERALQICRLPVVTAAKLQEACGALGDELRSYAGA